MAALLGQYCERWGWTLETRGQDRSASGWQLYPGAVGDPHGEGKDPTGELWGAPVPAVPCSPRHDVAEVAGLTSFSFGDDEDSRYVMVFKKVGDGRRHCGEDQGR